MKFVFKVTDTRDNHVGFIRDPLLNLSYFSKDAEYYEINSAQALTLKTRDIQRQLDKILDRNSKTFPTSKIFERIYESNYNQYKLGDLNVVAKPVKKYLF